MKRRPRHHQKPSTSKTPPTSFERFRNKYVTKSIACVVLLLIFWYCLSVRTHKRIVNIKPTHSKDKIKINLDYVTVHIDLKGAPPKMDYLIYLLPNLKALGVNSLLVEYEDMFPYDGIIVNVSTPLCYTKKQLTKFLVTAAKLGIEVIPLLNFFGNMEYVLKLEEFRYLREMPVEPRYFCSSRDYFTIVAEILTQVIKFHDAVAPVKHIHVGCKDVKYEMHCSRCAYELKTPSTIFIEHMKLVSRQIKFLAPNATILLWDDVIRRLIDIKDIPELTALVLGDLFKIEPVVSDPSPKLSRRTSHTHLHNVLELYRRSFGNIWIAPAFKGVDIVKGREAMVPDLKNRLLNNLNWLHFIQDYVFPNENVTFEFKGIILSGWSRKNHFAPINEILPVSLQTLTSSLRLIEKFKKGQQRIYKEKFSLREWDKVYKMFFEDIHSEVKGCHILSPIKHHLTAVCRINTRLTYDLYKTMRRYEYVLDNSLKTMTLNPIIMDQFGYNDMNLLENYGKNISKHVTEDLNHCEHKLRKYMQEFLDNSSIDEYIGYRSHTVKNRRNNYLSTISKMFSKRSWKRGRDLPKIDELHRPQGE